MCTKTKNAGCGNAGGGGEAGASGGGGLAGGGGGGLEIVGQCAEAGSEDHGDLRNDRGPRLDGADRIRNGHPAHFWPSSARSSASWRSRSARNPPIDRKSVV